MKDPLDLNFSSTIGTLIYPSKKIDERGKKLLSISDLQKRLEYYNKHICSLAYSYSGEGLHCFGEYEHYHGSGQVFFRVNSGSDLEFEIYLVERQKEIDRLKNLIEEHQEYFEKLKCFIEEKAGQVRFDELQVKSNAWEIFILNGGGTTPEHLSGSNNEIDLRPTSAEIINFNKYLRGYIQRLIAAPETLHWIVEQKYDGFLFSPGMEAFKRQLSRVSSKEAAIKVELLRIEKKFQLNSLSDYRDHIYPYKIENFNLWQAALFNAFVNGYEFDYNRKQLIPDQMKALIHVEQVFEYYKLLHSMAKEIQLEQQSEMKKEIPNLDVIRLIQERTELHNFLSVPSPDVLHENAFWHDENDSPIDCNIYHPKYGNNGFEAATKDVIVTSFNPVTIYQNEKTGKFIYCQYYLQTLCSADGITFTNRDGERVFKVNFLQTHQKRLAKNEQDFELLINREIEGQKITDSPETKEVFYTELIYHTKGLIELHKKRSGYNDGRDINVLALANIFIEYINKLTSKAKKEPEKSRLNFVEECLTELKSAFNNEDDYEKAVEYVTNYFLSKPLNIAKPIFIKNGNIKNLAFALGEIWRSQRNDVISYEYLKFYKDTFSIFSRQTIDKRNVFGSNLYKYSISKT